MLATLSYQTMPTNRSALIRYKVIDSCLQNRHRKWTLEDLIEAVSEALYEYEGTDTNISKRTIQLDIQNMRSDKLGYSAPIVITEKKYYTYEDKNFSIMQSNIGSQDLDKLSEIVKVLKQFKGFNYFEDISEMVGKIENKILKQKDNSRSYIDFEKNELLKGLDWIDPLLQAVKQQLPLDINYQSFKAREASWMTVSPYLLKEYRNRWFLLSRNHSSQQVIISALDRIVDIAQNDRFDFIQATDFEVNTFFDNVIGVTKTIHQKPIKVILKIDQNHAPYLLTKPLHHTQQVIEQDQTGTVISIEVVLNFELEREILGFGETIEVLYPRTLRTKIQDRLEKGGQRYEK
jgi:predicted DNA-binding transcriptional regulator YafY